MTSTPAGGASPLTLRNGFRCAPEANTSIEDVLLAVGTKVGNENISSASRMNKAVVVFLKNDNQVKNLIESGIWVNETYVPITPLSAPATKIVISNVPPFVRNESIIKELTRFGKIAGAIKDIPLGCKNAGLKHVLSFRRHVYMFLSSPTKTLDVSFRISHGESSYMVYASTESLRCFECGDIGHKRFTCPHKARNVNSEKEGPTEISDAPQIVTESTPQQPDAADTNTETLVELGSLIPQTHIPTLVISLVALTALVIVKEINSCYRHKLLLPVPIELMVIIAGTLVSHYTDLKAVNGVDVVGEIPSGLVPPRVPEVSFFSSVVGDAFAVAVVGYAISISLGKTFALKYGYKVDSNQELVALGFSNIIGGFFQCYSVTSSLSRSLVQESTGGKTQVAGVISAVIVLITVLKLSPLFEELPTAVLSTIVFVNLKGMFMQCQDIPALWKSNRVDLLVWLVTFLCTVLLNLDLGLAASIIFALLTVIFRMQRPRYSLLGRVADTELYLETESYKEAKAIPGIIIFRSSAMLYYPNAELYQEALLEKSGINVPELLKLKKRNKEEKAQKRQEREQDKQTGVLRELANRMLVSMKNVSESVHRQRTDNEHIINDNGIATVSHGNMNCGFQPEQDSEEEEQDKTDTHSSSCDNVQEHTHSIILDFTPVSFIDTVTLKTLKNIFQDFSEVDVTVYIAGCQVCVVQQLERGGFFSEFVSKGRLFPSIHDAVLHSLCQRDLSSSEFALETPCVTRF